MEPLQNFVVAEVILSPKWNIFITLILAQGVLGFLYNVQNNLGIIMTATKIYFPQRKCSSFFCTDHLVNPYFSWGMQLHDKWKPAKWLGAKASSFLTCSNMCISVTVSGTLLRWVDMSAESASGPIITWELLVTPVSTAKTTTILKAIIIYCKAQMSVKRKRLLVWKECRQGNEPPVSTELYNRGGRGSRGKRLCRSRCLPVYILFSLTKQTVPFYLVCSSYALTQLNSEPQSVLAPRGTD